MGRFLNLSCSNLLTYVQRFAWMHIVAADECPQHEEEERQVIDDWENFGLEALQRWGELHEDRPPAPESIEDLLDQNVPITGPLSDEGRTDIIAYYVAVREHGVELASALKRTNNVDAADRAGDFVEALRQPFSLGLVVDDPVREKLGERADRAFEEMTNADHMDLVTLLSEWASRPGEEILAA